MALTDNGVEPLDVLLPGFGRPLSPTPFADCLFYHDPDLDFSDPEAEMYPDTEMCPEAEMYPEAGMYLEAEMSASASVSASMHEASAGGYSPPAWRRLGNGRRDSGFWRGADNLLTLKPPRHVAPHPMRHRLSHRTSPDFESADEGQGDELACAIRTRLPTGSQSPEKGRSPSPEPDRLRMATTTITLNTDSKSPDPAALAEPQFKEPSENYVHFAVHADIRQRTEPIDTTINLVRTIFRKTTRSWTSLIFSIFCVVFSVSSLRALSQPPTPRPAGDLVKVAAVARSFEPLIYYSEHAVMQVHDLQATSIAVWDLGESVRTSTMGDASSIVKDLDDLSDTMKTLAIEMTRFFASVDGDVDGILSVMDWARIHLLRLHQHSDPGRLGAVYDNVHNMLSAAHVLEDSAGNPTALGEIANKAFGLSKPQRDQRVIQRLYNELLGVLEGTITAELQHSMTLFALFEAIDHHFLNLVRTVVRESSVQDEIHADLLSSLWTRLLGANASRLRKFEQNRSLLRNVRAKTVRNKGILLEHNGKLLTLKVSLESLRAKLVSPLVRGENCTTLALEDQIRGLEDVGSYLQAVRQQQKGKVMEMLFASVPYKSRLVVDGTVATPSGW